MKKFTWITKGIVKDNIAGGEYKLSGANIVPVMNVPDGDGFAVRIQQESGKPDVITVQKVEHMSGSRFQKILLSTEAILEDYTITE